MIGALLCFMAGCVLAILVHALRPANEKFVKWIKSLDPLAIFLGICYVTIVPFFLGMLFAEINGRIQNHKDPVKIVGIKK